MSRILRIELRRSSALGAALALVIGGAILCYATPQRWSAGWMALAMVEREYLILLWPLAIAAGAWQARREHRSSIDELAASTSRPRPQRILPVVGAMGIAVATAYLGVLAVTAPWIAGTAGYLPAAAFAVVAVGVLSVVAAVWLGLAIGHLLPWQATGPLLAVASIMALMGVPALAGSRAWLRALFSPMYGMSQFTDYQTVNNRLSAAEAVWLAALAGTGVLLLAAGRRRTRLTALVPAVLGAGVALLVAPHSDYVEIDPVAREQVCTSDAPRVCVARVHSGLLSEATAPARQGLALLAKLGDPATGAVEDTTTYVADEPAPALNGAVPMSIGSDPRGHLAHPGAIVEGMLQRALQGPVQCSDGFDGSVIRAAVLFLMNREPAPDPSFVSPADRAEEYQRVMGLWQGLKKLPEPEALARVAAVRDARQSCKDIGGLLGTNAR